MNINNPKICLLGLTAAALTLGGCTNDMEMDQNGPVKRITAEMVEPAAETRTCVDSQTLPLGFIGMMWEPGDKIGVYGTYDTNVPFANEATSNARKTTFSGHPQGMIQYAYYPWSAANDGVAMTELKGALPEEQAIYADHHMDVDYKFGKAENGAFDTEVRFQHLLSMARMEINAEGTGVSNESLQSITFTATRGGQPVMMSGDFTFDCTNGVVDMTKATGTAAKAVWREGRTLNGSFTGFMSLLPNLKRGDVMTISLLTDRQKVTFNVTIGVDFADGTVYTFPLALKKYQDNAAEYGWKVEPANPDAEVLTGTFTCAAMNVDGLAIANSGGPGKDGTTKIGEAIAAAGWDFFGVSEDFAYNSQLTAALNGYTSGTFRGNVSVSVNNDTDGLNFFVKKGFTFANESWTKYNESKGDLWHGADEYIQKGYRHYEVTVAEGVVIDVYITHMNTYSGSGNDDSNAYWKVQMSQLRQLRDAVLANVKVNKRPAIIMGDTNLRYTRHKIKEQLIDVIASNGLYINDPWVEFHRNGNYPEWNTKSLMINSKYFSDEKKYNTADDICCFDNNKGEVVDKIFYINVPGAPLQLKATSYKNDDSQSFVKETSDHKVTGITYEDENLVQHENQDMTITKRWGLADHFPAVATFTWTLTK